MPFSLKHKNWDSDFFGFKVADITGTGDASELRNICDALKKAHYRLAYWRVSSADVLSNSALENAGIKQIDTKVTFVKILDHISRNLFSYIEPYTGKINPELISLSLQSGEFSRFRNDPVFPVNTFEKLYTTWITKAVEENNVKKIFVSKESEKITGFVIVHEVNPERAEIDLIAVDKNYRGKKIGKELVHTAVKWSNENNYKELQVVTQKRNKAGCKFYEACGFNIEKEENVYHFWL
ncbi:MAG: GNAT family N-acetyltransferase [Chitinophagales bacterium]